MLGLRLDHLTMAWLQLLWTLALAWRCSEPERCEAWPEQYAASAPPWQAHQHSLTLRLSELAQFLLAQLLPNSPKGMHPCLASVAQAKTSKLAVESRMGCEEKSHCHLLTTAGSG
jgi:hypothetical protein